MRKLDLSKITVDHLSGGPECDVPRDTDDGGEEIGVELTAEKAQALRADLDSTATLSSESVSADVAGAVGGAGGQQGLGAPRRSRRGVG